MFELLCLFKPADINKTFVGFLSSKCQEFNICMWIQKKKIAYKFPNIEDDRN